MARTAKNSTWPLHLPKRHRMSAVSNSEGDHPRAVEPPRWTSTRATGTSPAGWLLGERSTRADELVELRRRLEEAERRALDAEGALPHLLALGQRTVNGLLGDARARGRAIIEEAREQAAREIAAERRALAEEAAELDALRMAVAAEAMGLEQIRVELDSKLAAGQLRAGGARQPALDAGAAPAVPDPAARLLPPPPPPTELAEVGMDTAEAEPDHGRASPREPSPSSRFADAWAADEDEMMVEAFDRFFAAEISRDPMRDSVLEADRTRASG